MTTSHFLHFLNKNLNSPNQDDVTHHFQQLEQIISFWANYKQDESDLIQVQAPLKTPFQKQLNRTYYIGDIHGDLNALLFNLLASGIAQFSDPFLCLFDPIHHRTLSIETVMANQVQHPDLMTYQLIPNLTFNQTSKNEVVMMGDILDRGRYMDTCMYLVIDLLNQQADAISDDQAWPLTVLFADHELYGFRCDVPILPNYNVENRYGPISDIKVLNHTPQHDIAIMSQALNQLFSKGHVRYIWGDSQGAYCSHSVWTLRFIEQLIATTSHPQWAALHQDFDVDALVKNCQKTLKDPIQGMAVLSPVINQLFVHLAKMIDPFNPNDYIDHPLITMRDGLNPIWARPTALVGHEHGIDDWLRLPGIIGHTQSNEGLIQPIESIVFDVDIAACYWYRNFGPRPKVYSRPRLIYIDQKQLYHLKFKDEETRFKI